MDIERSEIENEFDLSELERRMAAWRPTSRGLDRDRMLYEAGRAAARADGRVHSWRLATAALILMVVGLGGMLMRERSQRHAMEVALAARTRPSRSASPVPLLSATTAIEPFAPSSYFALTSRFSRSNPNMSSPDIDFEPEPHRQATGPLDLLPQRRPLQPRDLQRVLDL
jgi:hypothetical protein